MESHTGASLAWRTAAHGKASGWSRGKARGGRSGRLTTASHSPCPRATQQRGGRGIRNQPQAGASGKAWIRKGKMLPVTYDSKYEIHFSALHQKLNIPAVVCKSCGSNRKLLNACERSFWSGKTRKFI